MTLQVTDPDLPVSVQESPVDVWIGGVLLKGALSVVAHAWDLSKEVTIIVFTSSVVFSSVAQLCLTLCDPMNRTTSGLPVHHKLQEFTQTHAHRVGDATQPSHPLSSPPAPSPSQHQGLFQ